MSGNKMKKMFNIISPSMADNFVKLFNVFFFKKKSSLAVKY